MYKIYVDLDNTKPGILVSAIIKLLGTLPSKGCELTHGNQRNIRALGATDKYLHSVVQSHVKEWCSPTILLGQRRCHLHTHNFSDYVEADHQMQNYITISATSSEPTFIHFATTDAAILARAYLTSSNLAVRSSTAYCCGGKGFRVPRWDCKERWARFRAEHNLKKKRHKECDPIYTRDVGT